MVRFTFVPFFPRSRFIMSSRAIFTPAMGSSSTATMRSPLSMPTFSLGPLRTVWMTTSVSSSTLNCTPMPSKFPSRGSVMRRVSSASVYEECGSSLSSMPRMAYSVSLFWSTLSTYIEAIATCAICSLRSWSTSMLFKPCAHDVVSVLEIAATNMHESRYFIECLLFIIFFSFDTLRRGKFNLFREKIES